MIAEQTADKIAQEWIEAWNSHDLNAIIAHYANEVEFSSPFVTKLVGNLSGTIKGKKALRDYFAKGLAAYPDLKFELFQVLIGINSLTIYYRSIKNMFAAEVMILNEGGQIVKAIAHYK